MIPSQPRDNRRNWTNGRFRSRNQTPDDRYHVTTEKYSSQSSRWHSREGSFQSTPEQPKYHTREESENSQELDFGASNGTTRASLVDGMLQSLNGLPDASGPVPALEPYHTSFPGGEFRPSFDRRQYRRSQSYQGHPHYSGSQHPLAEELSFESPPEISPRKKAHKRRYTASNIRSKFSFSTPPLSSEDRRNLAASAAQAKNRESRSVSRSKSFENSKDQRPNPKQSGRLANMDQARSSQHRDDSPSGDFDLNPQDHQSRRRSRTYNAASASVLNRSRPVPPEYHDFKDGVRPTEQQSTHISRSEYPNGLDRPSSVAMQEGQGSRRDSATNVAEYSASRSREPGTSVSNQGSQGPQVPHSGSFTSTSSKGMLDSGNGKPKEKTGFLKRMFGSSRTSSNSDLRGQPPQLPPVTVESNKDTRRARAVQEHNATKGTIPKPPPVPQEDSNKQIPPQQLRQKTSFFRRRRKTLTEKEMRQAEPGQFDTPPHSGVPVPADDRPSTSSLRQAMHSYIGESTPPRKRQPDVQADVQAQVDAELESLEDIPVRRRAAEQQDAYEFLRSTSPGSVGRTKPTPQPPRPAHERRPSAGSKELRVRPSTSARDSKSINDSTMQQRSSGAPVPSDSKRQSNSIPLVDSHDNSSSRRRSATSPASRLHEDTPTKPNDDAPHHPPVVPKIETSPANRRVSGHPYTAPADTTKARDSDAGLLTTPPALHEPGNRTSSGRVWVQPEDSSEENLANQPAGVDSHTEDGRVGIKRAVASDISSPQEDFTSAKSERSIPPIQQDDTDEDVVSPLPTTEDFPASSSPAPLSYSDADHAKRIFEAQNDPQTRAQGALELGEAGETADRLRSAFMSNFDFAGLSILLALRDLCARMMLKGETQQMDRIISAFSQRWCDCNPNHGFKSGDVVHAICYSLLLLNTDLHVADLTDKMTRTQFVKNTIPTLRRVADAEPLSPGSTLRANQPDARGSYPFPEARSNSVAEADTRLSADDRGCASRLSNKRSLRPTSEIPSIASPSPYDSHPVDPSEFLVNAPYEGTMKGWEAALETVLKEFYLSIRQLKLPLHGAEEVALQEQPSSNSLSVVTNMIRRTGSVISKTTSEDSRGRTSTFRSAASRFTSKNRSRPRLYPTSTLASSRTASRTSLEDGNLWSPSASSINSQGKTLTTMSTESLTSRLSPAEQGYQQSIGFANALSHVIIREEGTADDLPPEGDVPLLDDDSLELAGAPWAKEGIVQHKHHLEMEGKKARDRNWSECFAVIQRGTMRLFSFSHKSSKSQQKNKASAKAGAVVGGGNWLENAENLASFTLRHTIANALPPPGYSKQRPHVFALSLPTGAVHLFHVGTSEIAQEFVMTANYWSARLSKEPLVGGVSSIEYGWGESVINTALIGLSSTSDVPSSAGSKRDTTAPPSSFHPLGGTESAATGRTSSSGGRSLHSPTPSASISLNNGVGQAGDRATSGRPSISGSLRSSFDAPRPAAFRNRLPADRIVLGSWQPPQQSLMPSKLPEVEQLTALKNYVSSIEEELAKHNELRPGVVLAFSPRSVNATKALGNWERKSHYLLREIVKFRTYVDVLEAAEQRRGEIKGEQLATGKSTGDRKGQIREVESEEDFELSEETMEALRLSRNRADTKDSTTKT